MEPYQTEIRWDKRSTQGHNSSIWPVICKHGDRVNIIKGAKTSALKTSPDVSCKYLGSLIKWHCIQRITGNMSNFTIADIPRWPLYIASSWNDGKLSTTILIRLWADPLQSRIQFANEPPNFYRHSRLLSPKPYRLRCHSTKPASVYVLLHWGVYDVFQVEVCPPQLKNGTHASAHPKTSLCRRQGMSTECPPRTTLIITWSPRSQFPMNCFLCTYVHAYIHKHIHAHMLQ